MVLDDLLDVMVERGASDLHLTDGRVPYLRVGGEMEALTAWPVLDDTGLNAIVSRLSGSTASASEIDCSVTLGELRLRVNVYRSQGRGAAAIRLIPLAVPRIDDLGLPSALHRWPSLRSGLLLCAGPTGSGKTTTLAAVVRAISESRACHIITMEDPIEYVHSSDLALVHQRAIGQDSPSFATALRAVLREDPDVILVGEMRDPETIRLALTAAETGHLVLSTVHASDAVGLVNRIIDVFPGDEQPQVRTMLASTLAGASCQALLSDAHLTDRRHLVAEVLVPNAAVRAAIREGRTTAIAQAVETGVAEGMQTFDRALALAVGSGHVARSDAESMSSDRAAFAKTLREIARAGRD